jgi:predicted hydrocarbon binding protein
VAAWSEVFLRTLHLSLAPEPTDAARLVLYRAGFEWGLQELLHLSRRIREESGSDHDLWQTDATVVFERWSAPLAVAGWGTWTFDRSAHARGLTVVELRHSAVTAALKSEPPSAEPVCHLYAGLFAGALSFYDRTEAHAIETSCAALGDDCCRFLVGAGPLIDRAEAARRQGAKHADIVSAVLTPPAAAPAPKPAPAKPANIPWGKK